MSSGFTLADLVEITGANRRSIQLWAEAEAIRANTGTDREGTGIHRRFDRREAMIACVLAVVSKLKVPIGVLKRVGYHTRTAMEGPDAMLHFEACAAGALPLYLFYGISSSDQDFTMQFVGIERGDDVAKVVGESVLRLEERSGRVVVAINLLPHMRRLG